MECVALNFLNNQEILLAQDFVLSMQESSTLQSLLQHIQKKLRSELRGADSCVKMILHAPPNHSYTT